jgi:farnesyl diphosphate synthase
MPITRPEFEAYFPQLVEDLLAHSEEYGLPVQALEWFRNVRQTNSGDSLSY